MVGGAGLGLRHLLGALGPLVRCWASTFAAAEVEKPEALPCSLIHIPALQGTSNFNTPCPSLGSRNGPGASPYALALYPPRAPPSAVLRRQCCFIHCSPGWLVCAL